MGLRGYGAKPKIKDAKHVASLRTEFPWQAEGLTTAQKVIAFCEFCPITSGRLTGQNFVIRDWQRDFIEAVFAETDGVRPVRKAVLSLPRKCGKTALTALLAMAALIGPLAVPRGQVLSAATDKLQAALIFAELEALIDAVPEFAAVANVKRFTKEIEILSGAGKGTTYRALSSDAKSAHGLSPHFCVYDEYGQARNSELWEALSTASGARQNPLFITISTEAADDAAPMSRLVDYGKDVMSRKVDDPAFHLTRFGAEPDDDPFEEATWFKAIPALDDFRSLEDVRAQAKQAQESLSFESPFLNLTLNLRTASEVRFVNPAEWKANGEEAHIEAGAVVYGGLDLSWSRDLSAFVLVAPRTDGTFDIQSEYFLPATGLQTKSREDRIPWDQWAKAGILTTCEGKVNDMGLIARRVLRAERSYRLETIAYDRWGMAHLQRELDGAGVTTSLSEFGQGFKGFSPAVDTLERCIAQGLLRHGGDPILTMCALNAVVVRDPSGNRKLDKSRSAGKIDGLVALAMALQAAQEFEAVVLPSCIARHL